MIPRKLVLRSLGLAAIVPLLGCAGREAESAPRTSPPAAAAVAPAAADSALAMGGVSSDANDTFAATVAPMLARRCAPCHVPGGKLYDRLPFDSSQVVLSHKTGILKRLEGDDKKALEEWANGMAAATP